MPGFVAQKKENSKRDLKELKPDVVAKINDDYPDYSKDL